MMVEDHPFDYGGFEGIIPKGNYGAGMVIVWDRGSYEPIDPVKSKKEADKLFRKQLKQGSLKFILKGKKLKGEFALVRTNGMGDNAWLLIKHRDKYAQKEDITKNEKSVLSGKTIAGMEKAPDKVYGKNSKNKAASKIKNDDAEKAPFPKSISPMLATLVDAPVTDKGWLFEIKWDGYRAIGLCKKDNVEIISRNNKPFSEKYYPIHDALQELKLNAVLDGEIVVLKENGISNFGALQNWRSEADGELFYYVFDLLWLNGYDLKDLPLADRRELLHGLLPADGIIRESETFDNNATEMLTAAAKMGLEGIIAKRADSFYKEKDRSRDWLKIKVQKRHEAVIGGYTINEDSPKLFSSLLVGVYSKNELHYIGKVGTGFNVRLQKEMMAKFKPLKVKGSPFKITPDVNEPSRFRPNPPHAKAYWLKPKLVCEVVYAELTSDGVMRHPSFQGMREDKSAKDVHAEVARHTKDLVKKTGVKLKGTSGGRKTLLNPTEETQVKAVNGHELKFSNLSKIFWPGEGYTKRDLLNYYYQVAEYILPYLKDRPQSLNRFPNGIEGKSFYFKDVTATAPDWVKQFPYTTNEGEDKNFLVVEDEASILWMANLGAIEMNPWNSTIQKPDNPDWCVIDLDPTEKNSFDQVLQCAQAAKKVLDSLKITGYPKTSGSTGIHIYIPLEAKYSYDECQLFARLIATRVHQILPAFTSIERMTNNRKGKIYVDFLQNRAKATLAAPYAVRPKPAATVSMPLDWSEIKKGLKMTQFTIKNALARIKTEGDLFKPVLGKGVDIEKAIKELK
jgi:bifunctional non-homologous end joining protein LigD